MTDILDRLLSPDCTLADREEAARQIRLLRTDLHAWGKHLPDCDWHTDQYSWECTCRLAEFQARLNAGRKES